MNCPFPPVPRCRVIAHTWLIVTFAACVFTRSTIAGPEAAPLSPRKTPAENFDLTHWKLTLPISESGETTGAPAEIEPTTLASVAFYSSEAYRKRFGRYFFTSDEDGALVFRSPSRGARTRNTKYTRCELREMIDPKNDNINWTTDGTHQLLAQCAVTSLPTSGEVIIGQIHAVLSDGGHAPPLVKLQFEKASAGYKLRALCKNNAEGGAETSLIFPKVKLDLGDPIAYEIRVENKTLHVLVNGTAGRVKGSEVDGIVLDPSWDAVRFYFKAGNYNQDASGDESVAEVQFQKLSATHKQ